MDSDANTATTATNSKRCGDVSSSPPTAPYISTSIIPLSSLNPPPSKIETLRDKWLDFLSGKIHFWVGVTVFILIIIDGAFFFFLLIGAQNMCRPRMDCEPRNWWLNFSIQFLTVLFTYLATISLPWRLSNATHLFVNSGKYNRSSDAGLDLYGRPTEQIWYHISQSRRRLVVVFLILNSLTQYANQTSRIIFYTYELADVFPGNLWTLLFFVLSMLFAAVGGGLQLHAERLRKVHPERFPPSLWETSKEYLAKARSGLRRQSISEEKGDEEEVVEPREEDDVFVDNRRNKLERGKSQIFQNMRDFFVNDAPSLSLWGL